MKRRSKQERNFVKYVSDRVMEGLSDSFDIYSIPDGKIPVYKVEDVEHVKRVIMKFYFFHRRPNFLNYLFTRSYTVSKFFNPMKELYIAWLCTPIMDSDRRSGFLPKKNTFDPKADYVNYNLYDFEDPGRTPVGICYFKISLGELSRETIETLENLFSKMEKERTIKIDTLSLIHEDTQWNEEEDRFDNIDVEYNPIMI